MSAECEWCGEEGHEPAEVKLGCCGGVVVRCIGPGMQEQADGEVCDYCDEHGPKVRYMEDGL